MVKVTVGCYGVIGAEQARRRAALIVTRIKAGDEPVPIPLAVKTVALGETLPVIGKLLGHSDIETTARYAHLARDSLHAAVERVAASIAADIF